MGNLKLEKPIPPTILTDMAFHSAEPRKPKSWFAKILEVFRSKKTEGRMHTKDFKVTKDGNNITIDFKFHTTPEEKQRIEEYKAKTGQYPVIGLPLDKEFPISFQEPLQSKRAKERRKWKKIDKYL